MSIKHIKAFTLIELVVCIGIVTVLMAVVLFNYRGFLDNLALSSAGQEIAIAIREAQTYGLNVRESAVSSSNFSYAYGIFFDINATNSYTVFVDKNGDAKYTPGGFCGTNGSECVEQFSIRDGVTVSSIASSSGCPSINAARTLHVTFLRPNPDADINFVNNGGGIVCSSQADGEIVLTSPQGRTLTITVQNTGQISAQ